MPLDFYPVLCYNISMMNDTKTPQTNVSTTEYSLQQLEDKCATQEQKIQELEAKVHFYEEQFRLNQHRRFGTSSEKSTLDQIDFFNEPEQATDAKAEEPTFEEINYKRRKAQGKREADLKDLPVETIEYRLSEDEQVCPQCGEALHEMSTEIRRELKIIPAQVVVVEHVRYVYACRNCEKNDIATPIITATMPNPVLPKSLVSPSLLAYIIDQKYTQGLPLYRQEQQFQRFDVDISRQNMANWIIHGANVWLSPIYQRLREYMLHEAVLHADETPLQVLHEDGREATSQSYMWMFATGHIGRPIYLYEYQTTRASKHPKRFLEGFKGYLHTDGYAGYNDIPGVTLVGCFAHARRKFCDALKAMPDKTAISHTNASEGLEFCNRLFAIEEKLKEFTPQQRYEQRLEQLKPVLDAFLTWLKAKKTQALPKSAFGQAITYCLNQWPKLTNILKDGRLELSNNRGERAIKPFVIGRKNFLFCNTPKGATSSAIAYSIVETAKANGLSPFHYLKYLFEQLPNININDADILDSLLPWSDGIPTACRVKKHH